LLSLAAVQSLVSDARTSERESLIAEASKLVDRYEAEKKELEDKITLLDKSFEIARAQVSYLEKMLAREQELNDALIQKVTAPYEDVDITTLPKQERIPGHTTLRARREELNRLSREARERMDAAKSQGASS